MTSVTSPVSVSSSTENTWRSIGVSGTNASTSAFGGSSNWTIANRVAGTLSAVDHTA